MEEKDIKIIEEYLEEARDENSFTDCEGLFEDKFFISLDKLLKRYKEERDLRIHFENRLDNMEQLYIDKDKVRDKIDELENKKDIIDNQTYSFEEVMEAIIAGLQELLEERK